MTVVGFFFLPFWVYGNYIRLHRDAHMFFPMLFSSAGHCRVYRVPVLRRAPGGFFL